MKVKLQASLFSICLFNGLLNGGRGGGLYLCGIIYSLVNGWAYIQGGFKVGFYSILFHSRPLYKGSFDLYIYNAHFSFTEHSISFPCCLLNNFGLGSDSIKFLHQNNDDLT